MVCEARPGDGWQLTTQPGSSAPALHGEITECRRLVKLECGYDIGALQTSAKKDYDARGGVVTTLSRERGAATEIDVRRKALQQRIAKEDSDGGRQGTEAV